MVDNKLTFTKRETAVLMSIFKDNKVNQQSFIDHHCYGILAGKTMRQIDDDRINDKLCSHFGITVDDNSHMTKAFTFWFNWVNQLWYVGA